MVTLNIDADAPPSWVEVVFLLGDLDSCYNEINRIEGAAF